MNLYCVREMERGTTHGKRGKERRRNGENDKRKKTLSKVQRRAVLSSLVIEKNSLNIRRNNSLHLQLIAQPGKMSSSNGEIRTKGSTISPTIMHPCSLTYHTYLCTFAYIKISAHGPTSHAHLKVRCMFSPVH